MPLELRGRALGEAPPDPRQGSRRVPTGNPRGRPRLNYAQKRSKESRKIDVNATFNILTEIPFGQAVDAFMKLLRESGKQGEEAVCKKIFDGQWQVKDIVDRYNNPAKPLEPLTPLTSLRLLFDCGLSKEKYRHIMQTVNACGAKILPGYEQLLKMKNNIRPDRGIDIQESSARIELQPLLDKTMERAILVNEDQIDERFEALQRTRIQAKFFCSYGFDGSTGHSIYHQNFRVEVDRNALERPDYCLIFASLNPLRLVDDDGVILWENPSPYSSRLVRPIMLSFEKETPQFTEQIVSELEDEVGSLAALRATTSTGNLIVAEPKLYMTQIDGKVLSNIMGTSSQCCAICGALPSQFNVEANIGTDIFRPFEDALNYGISPLHCWLNTFNHLFKLSVRIPIEQGRVEGAENRQICRERKSQLQTTLKQELGIRAFFPNPNGTGNSNNGNCARRAFQEPEKFARILGLDEEMVKDLRTLLICVSSRYKIDPVRYERLALRVFRRYIAHYGWYNLSPTLHRLLIHGGEIARHLPLPTGILTEEGLEKKHKDVKKCRRDHCRTTNRHDNMSDMLHRALDMSDPVLACLAMERASKYNRFHVLPADAREILIMNESENIGTDNEDGIHEDDHHENMLNAALDDYELPNDDDI